MGHEYVEVERDGDVATIWMNRPKQRNALSLRHLEELTQSFRQVSTTPGVRGVVLGGRGPVFSAGHDFADMVGADLEAMRRLLWQCTELVQLMASIPQPVIARVHGLATAAGCQLVATADLAIALDSAGFAAPGGKGGWFCHTPMVAIARNVGRKRAAELAFTGDVIDAHTALDWGLLNRVVTGGEDALDEAVRELLGRAIRGSMSSKAVGKRALYTQLDLPVGQAYGYAVEVMAATSQTDDAREGVTAFLEKRPPVFRE